MTWAGKLQTGLAVAFFAWVGMLMRFGLALLTAHLDFGLTTSETPGTDLCLKRTGASGYFLQNMLGCFLMAIVARHKPKLKTHVAAGLSTGLCGSLTTWATWMEEEAFTFLSGKPFQACISAICMLSVSLGSFSLGEIAADCGMGVEPSIPLKLQVCAREASSSSSSSDEASPGAASAGDWALEMAAPPAAAAGEDMHQLSRGIHGFILGSAATVVLGALALLVLYKNTQGLLYLALAPLGALLRWLLSLGNPSTAPLPIFTLLANTLGCGVDAAAAVMIGRAEAGWERQLWTGLATGFAGSLSTVSTFMAELRASSLGGFRMRATYFLVSFGFAMAVLLPTYSNFKCPQH